MKSRPHSLVMDWFAKLVDQNMAYSESLSSSVPLDVSSVETDDCSTNFVKLLTTRYTGDH